MCDESDHMRTDTMSDVQVNDIVSEQSFYPNNDGKKIVAYVDCRDGDEDAPSSSLRPKYGESKKNNLSLAYYLVSNGFRVIRFDFTSPFRRVRRVDARFHP